MIQDEYTKFVCIVFYPHHMPNPTGMKYTEYFKYSLIMYKRWVLYTSIVLGCADATDWVICDAQGNVFEETREAGNVVPDILHRAMYSYVQHWNTLRNADHSGDVNTQGNGGYGSGEYEVLKFDIKNLVTLSEANNREFFLGGDYFEGTKMMLLSGHRTMFFDLVVRRR